MIKHNIPRQTLLQTYVIKRWFLFMCKYVYLAGYAAIEIPQVLVPLLGVYLHKYIATEEHRA